MIAAGSAIERDVCVLESAIRNKASADLEGAMWDAHRLSGQLADISMAIAELRAAGDEE